jgi:hypothetical protein
MSGDAFKSGALFQVMEWASNPSVHLNVSKSGITIKSNKTGATTGETTFELCRTTGF